MFQKRMRRSYISTEYTGNDSRHPIILNTKYTRLNLLRRYNSYGSPMEKCFLSGCQHS